MKIIPICPDCGLPGVKVNQKAVAFNLKKSEKIREVHDHKWYACINPECKISYFSGEKSIPSSTLARSLFYKDKSDNAVICYCADLTRGDIKKAVRNGRTTAGEVRKYTKKTGSGNCDKKNPLGKCCKTVLLRTVKEELNK
jgi:NAD(P)H-nitrite reductase large subunit